MEVTPCDWKARAVRLDPLSFDHLDGLCAVGLDSELWRFTTTSVTTVDDMRRYVESALEWQRNGTALPFVIIEKKTGSVVGSTRYANIDHSHRRLEIGWTWVARAWQRTPVNTEAKYLLLTHAFEALGCIRVEFKTDVLNTQSRNALKRIGATEEGILRCHMITDSGRIRNTVYFSIIASEWPSVKDRLRAWLGYGERT